jgi:adenylate cyclase
MSEGTQRRLAAIVSVDVVGYSLLMGTDEVGTLGALNAHRAELIDPLIEKHGGRIVKTMGDGLLLEFPSVVAAVECVIAAQKGMAERNAALAADRAIRFRVGVHLGDVKAMISSAMASMSRPGWKGCQKRMVLHYRTTPIDRCGIV